MSRFGIEVEPHGSLFIGGYAEAAGASDGDTAADGRGLLLPGSAVKGALREAARRLVNGCGRGEEVFDRLFGVEERRAGVLRVGPLRADRGGRSAEPDLAPTVRHHVSLERAVRQAAPGRLFENRVTPAGVVFCGELRCLRPLDEDERGLLLASAEIADQLGGGRGRGLGHVRIGLHPRPEEDTQEPITPGLPERARSVVLVLESTEPLHLAAVKDPGNLTPTKTHLDGSAVRGAVAAVLAASLGDEEMDRLFGDGSPAVFGDAHPGAAEAIPAPLTLREPKGGGPPSDDAGWLCVEALTARRYRRPADTRYAKPGTYRPAPDGGWERVAVPLRTVTRAARDHASGRGADGLLYSLEVVDPYLEQGSGEHRPLRFYAPVEGDSVQLRQVVAAAASGLAVGGDRSRGFGSLRLAEHLALSVLARLENRYERWIHLVDGLDVPHPESTGVVLALGPLALTQRELIVGLEHRGLRLLGGVTRRAAHAGWNAAVGLPRTVRGQFVPGSVFVVGTPDGRPAFEALAALERDGLGPGRADGWGRLAACHPIHADCWKEEES